MYIIQTGMDVKAKPARPLRELYTELADTYERTNRILTLGLDRIWRRRAARRAAEGGGTLWLDVCSGTGEMARDLSRLAPPGTRIVAADFSLPMLSYARTKRFAAPASFVLAEAKRLPLPDASVDLVTVSFATRNLAPSREILAAAFREFHRVLKPGGRFLNLETSQPRNRLIRAMFHAYVALGVKRIGYGISGSRAGYAYLAASMRGFYGPDELALILSEAGFAPIAIAPLMFGASAVHLAVKPGGPSPA
jgi:demethylmenaquinone methyltransferase / 2-methoxy-6-polyprenyl-1,4-benzoquinol methylase